tara:strand:- start:53 stop:763 length:711 start_codon:yes stop_codon:yes gene_type:complete
MALLFKRLKFLLLIFFITLLFSCSKKYSESTYQDLAKNTQNNESININNLLLNLLEADKKLTPKIVYNRDGSSFYRYTKKPGEGDITLKDIKNRILLGSDFYEIDRENVRILLERINDLKINNRLDHIDSGALGLWIPSNDLIVVDYKVIDMGSSIFLDILQHEVIHVAQSCFSSSRKNFPKRIGLPLEFSRDINLNLSHKVYSTNSEEVMYIEREAFTYSKIEGAAIKLLNKFCE